MSLKYTDAVTFTSCVTSTSGSFMQATCAHRSFELVLCFCRHATLSSIAALAMSATSQARHDSNIVMSSIADASSPFRALQLHRAQLLWLQQTASSGLEVHDALNSWVTPFLCVCLCLCTRPTAEHVAQPDNMQKL